MLDKFPTHIQRICRVLHRSDYPARLQLPTSGRCRAGGGLIRLVIRIRATTDPATCGITTEVLPVEDEYRAARAAPLLCGAESIVVADRAVVVEAGKEFVTTRDGRVHSFQ